MTEEEIKKERQQRVADCRAEIEGILAKYQLALTAEDYIGQYSKISVQLQFMDLKKPESPIAQPVNPMADLLKDEGDPIPPKKKK